MTSKVARDWRLTRQRRCSDVELGVRREVLPRFPLGSLLFLVSKVRYRRSESEVPTEMWRHQKTTEYSILLTVHRCHLTDLKSEPIVPLNIHTLIRTRFSVWNSMSSCTDWKSAPNQLGVLIRERITRKPMSVSSEEETS